MMDVIEGRLEEDLLVKEETLFLSIRETEAALPSEKIEEAPWRPKGNDDVGSSHDSRTRSCSESKLFETGFLGG